MEHDTNKATITILLTRYSGWFSDFIYWISGRGYTHASISLNEGEFYYSFNFKGFRHEYPKRMAQKCRKSESYQLEISDETYEKICSRIKEMERDKEKLSYSRLGVVLCLLHIPCKMKNSYFCSQFVMEILEMSGCVSLEKDASLYLPNQIPDFLRRTGRCTSIAYNPV